MLAKKLMFLHEKKDDAHKVDEIVENLTSKLFFHGHPINRTEAKEIGFDNIVIPSTELEDLIWKLYCEYEKEMKLNTKFNHVEDFIKANPTITQGQTIVYRLPKQKAVYIESDGKTNVNTIDFEVIGTKLPNGLVQGQLSTLRQDWEEE